MEDNFNKHLGNKLKLRRLALGLTQTKVAKAINVTFQQNNNITILIGIINQFNMTAMYRIKTTTN